MIKLTIELEIESDDDPAVETFLDNDLESSDLIGVLSDRVFDALEAKGINVTSVSVTAIGPE